MCLQRTTRQGGLLMFCPNVLLCSVLSNGRSGLSDCIQRTTGHVLWLLELSFILLSVRWRGNVCQETVCSTVFLSSNLARSSTPTTSADVQHASVGLFEIHEQPVHILLPSGNCMLLLLSVLFNSSSTTIRKCCLSGLFFPSTSFYMSFLIFYKFESHSLCLVLR
jgi:hypothetical protein